MANESDSGEGRQKPVRFRDFFVPGRTTREDYDQWKEQRAQKKEDWRRRHWIAAGAGDKTKAGAVKVGQGAGKIAEKGWEGAKQGVRSTADLAGKAYEKRGSILGWIVSIVCYLASITFALVVRNPWLAIGMIIFTLFIMHYTGIGKDHKVIYVAMIALLVIIGVVAGVGLTFGQTEAGEAAGAAHIIRTAASGVTDPVVRAMRCVENYEQCDLSLQKNAIQSLGEYDRVKDEGMVINIRPDTGTAGGKEAQAFVVGDNTGLFIRYAIVGMDGTFPVSFTVEACDIPSMASALEKAAGGLYTTGKAITGKLVGEALQKAEDKITDVKEGTSEAKAILNIESCNDIRITEKDKFDCHLPEGDGEREFTTVSTEERNGQVHCFGPKHNDYGDYFNLVVATYTFKTISWKDVIIAHPIVYSDILDHIESESISNIVNEINRRWPGTITTEDLTSYYMPANPIEVRFGKDVVMLSADQSRKYALKLGIKNPIGSKDYSELEASSGIKKSSARGGGRITGISEIYVELPKYFIIEDINWQCQEIAGRAKQRCRYNPPTEQSIWSLGKLESEVRTAAGGMGELRPSDDTVYFPIQYTIPTEALGKADIMDAQIRADVTYEYEEIFETKTMVRSFGIG